jgi:hypothetical protein
LSPFTLKINAEPTICLFTDSAGGRDKGFGIYFQGKWAQGRWPKEWADNGILADITF